MPPIMRRARARRRRRLTATLTLLVVVPGVTAVSTYAKDVDRGVHVLGVDIGGRSGAEAADALRAGLGDRLAEAVPVRSTRRPATVDPAAVGLNLDVEATVDPGRLRAAEPVPRALRRDHREVEPVVTVDTTCWKRPVRPRCAS